MRGEARQLTDGIARGAGWADSAENLSCGRRDFLRWTAGLVTLGAVLPVPHGTLAGPPHRPNTSRAAREEAIREMPIASLQEPYRSKIQEIVGQPTIYRRLPVEVIPCDPDLYLFLVRYPEVVVNMWQLMGVTKVVLQRTSDYAYDAQDGAGTISQVQLIYGTRDKHLFLAEGYYEGPLLPRRISGRCVLLLHSAYSRDQHQRDFVSNQLDVFLQLDNVGAEFVAKTLHPLMGRTVDSNFLETARFIGQLSHVAETNGPGVQRLATRLNAIEPGVRNRFVHVASNVYQRATVRAMMESEANSAARVSGTEPFDPLIGR
jgi:hypothetical protein